MMGVIGGLSGGAGGLDMGGGGPSANTSTTNNHSGFNGGNINMGSNNGIPTWAIVGGLALLAVFVLKGSGGRGRRR
ncbi:hypothetical protein [Aliivibrio fischeri]|uniref:hypothetical protein n=1 Tax=Aliivibrio fischeri TaxID=668 RepID=UPI0007C4C7CA|nr:hypothetical protein [Aliivibrio fischeri]